jgi:GTP cyclohydrolase II
LQVVETMPIMAVPNPHNMKYLKTKKTKMGHKLDFPDIDGSELAGE